MKLLSRLIIALAVCLVAIPLIASPIQAAYISSMSLHASSDTVGEEVYITGYSDGTDNYWAYYKIDTDEWEEVLDYHDFDFEQIAVDEWIFETEYFEVPESCGGKHEVAICDRECDTDDDDEIEDYRERSRDFTVKPKVEITSPSDAEGSMGTQVTVKGTGFGESERYISILFNGDEVSTQDFTANKYGTWQGTFIVPATSKGDHDVSAEGEDTNEDDVEEATFTMEPGISLSKSSGNVGDIVVVTGSGFGNKEKNIKVTYDDEQVGSSTTADSNGTWDIEFAVPESAKGRHDIDAYGSSTSGSDIADKTFTVSPKVTLNPSGGHVGTILSVNGTGFAANQSVTITYQDETATSTTNSKGSFPASGSVTLEAKGFHGSQPVQATDASYNTATGNFVMESTPPPKAPLISPANGSRVGLVGKQAPTFKWGAIGDEMDPSGISHYSLQIATSANFTAEDIMFSQDLAAANVTADAETNTVSYTLAKDHALPYGSYYWQVRAVDNAQNVGEWSDSYSFKAGLLPQWAFIASAAAIAVLIGALVYIFVIRRRVLYD